MDFKFKTINFSFKKCVDYFKPFFIFITSESFYRVFSLLLVFFLPFFSMKFQLFKEEVKNCELRKSRAMGSFVELEIKIFSEAERISKSKKSKPERVEQASIQLVKDILLFSEHLEKGIHRMLGENKNRDKVTIFFIIDSLRRIDYLHYFYKSNKAVSIAQNIRELNDIFINDMKGNHSCERMLDFWNITKNLF